MESGGCSANFWMGPVRTALVGNGPLAPPPGAHMGFLVPRWNDAHRGSAVPVRCQRHAPLPTGRTSVIPFPSHIPLRSAVAITHHRRVAHHPAMVPRGHEWSG